MRQPLLLNFTKRDFGKKRIRKIRSPFEKKLHNISSNSTHTFRSSSNQNAYTPEFQCFKYLFLAQILMFSKRKFGRVLAEIETLSDKE